MIGTFLDTMIVCTITGLTIVMSQLYIGVPENEIGNVQSVLIGQAFEYFLPGVGNYIVVFAILLFAYSTIIGWSYIADIFNGLMAIPNLIALLFLSGVIVSETQKFREVRSQEKIQQKQQKAS